MRRILFMLVVLTATLSAGAQTTQQVAAIRKAYAEAKEAIAQYEKNPKDVTHCSKSEVVNDYMAPGSGPVHEIIRFYHHGAEVTDEGYMPVIPFFVTRNHNHPQGSFSMYEEYLFNDKGDLIFYFRKAGDDETRYYWSSNQLIDEKIKGERTFDDVSVQRYALNFCKVLERLMNLESYLAY